jgi:mannose-6-phosphate isomerase
VKPIVLRANRPRQWYRGGAAIDALRGERSDGWRPEDWIASTAERFGEPGAGLTMIGDRTLRELIAEDPVGFLGPGHVAAYGPESALLTKLLDPGQNLPVHVHPGAEFARTHLNTRFGKTEAWLVLAAAPGGCLHIGFTREVAADELHAWVARGDRAAMIDEMNTVAATAGDAYFIPAGLPHAIDAGVFIVEVQEPTDHSIVLEADGLSLEMDAMMLGLGVEALVVVDRTEWSPERLSTITRSADHGGVSRLPSSADSYFRVDRLTGSSERELPAAFHVIVVVDGEGQLDWERGGGGPLAIRRGDTLTAPHGAGRLQISGAVDVLACAAGLPPS